MALTAATNCTSPVATTKWAGADSDPYDRAEQLAGVAENFDSHDHTSGKCLGVGRVQTSAVPDAAGEVRVNDSNALVTYYANSALRTLVELDLTQTLTAKTLTSPTINSGTVGTKLIFSDAASLVKPGATSLALQNNAESANNLFLADAGLVCIRDNANANMTIGLTINQGANDNEILALKSSDVAHGMTSQAETDTYGIFKKYQADGGGLRVVGFGDADVAERRGLVLQGFIAAQANTTKSTSGQGVVTLTAAIADGINTQAVGADGNLVVFENAATTRFIFDAEGSFHADVESTTFDAYDDIALLNAFDAEFQRRRDPVKHEFGEWLQEHRETLQRERIVNFYDDGPRGMVNFTRLSMLLVGAVRQLGDRLQLTEAKLAALPGGTA